MVGAEEMGQWREKKKEGDWLVGLLCFIAEMMNPIDCFGFFLMQ
jgi:hypothetical protein